MKKEESKILQLKIKLKKTEKVDTLTIRKLNKLLLQRHNLVKNYNNTNIQNNNQQIINNIQLIGFGKEDIPEALTNQEKKIIMNAKYNSLHKLIEIVHCGKYNQFKNILLTNMKDNYMFRYDASKGHFVLTTKTDLLNTLIDHRVNDLEVIYHELLEKNKLDDSTKDCIENFINKIQNDDIEEQDKYRKYKISEIKLLLYNNQDDIQDNISLMLTTTS